MRSSDRSPERSADRPRARGPVRALALLLGLTAVGLLLAAPRGTLPARAEEERDARSVAAPNGVVLHGVDKELLAARLREADARSAAGAHDVAARELADLAAADLSALVEEGAGTFLCGEEAVLLRVAALPPEGLAAYRRLLDARAEAALDAAVRSGNPGPLARDAVRLVHTTAGTKLLATLADLRAARGDLEGAVRALEDALRLRPGDGPVPRTALVSRLAALHAARGDADAVRSLAPELPEARLAGPSALLPGRTVRDELALAAGLAAARDPAPSAPRKALRIAGEVRIADESRDRATTSLLFGPVQVPERPLPIGTEERPTLLVRVPQRKRGTIAVAALGLDRAANALRPLWAWPAQEAEPQVAEPSVPFDPVRVSEDTVAFAWPSESAARLFEEERHTLVLLDIAAEGKAADVRGEEENRRPEADRAPLLESLSCAARPAVSGSSVFALFVAPAEGGRATQLHAARFDLTGGPGQRRLRLRWMRHLLDGTGVPPALFPSHEDAYLPRTPLALPAPPLVRAGRLYVSSNTGALLCLDAASGRTEWVETYARYGPSSRTTVRESEPRSWFDAPLFADGPWLFATPRDAESLLQFRLAPRGVRGTLVESFALSGRMGTASAQGRLLPDVLPDEVFGVRGGRVWLAGRVARRPAGSLPQQGGPLAAFDLGFRGARIAQVEEFAAAGRPLLCRADVVFPTSKALYRVPADDVEGPVQVLWRDETRDRRADRLGNLVPDGRVLWSVTPSRIVAFVEAD